MLKCVIFAGCVALAFGRLDEKDYGKKLGELAVLLNEKCTLYTGITDDMKEHVRNGNFNSSDPDPILKRYNACAWIETGVVDLNLNINLERMTEIEPEHFHGKGVKLHSNCIKEAIKSDATNTLDKLWNASKCSYKSDPEVAVGTAVAVHPKDGHSVISTTFAVPIIVEIKMQEKYHRKPAFHIPVKEGIELYNVLNEKKGRWSEAKQYV